MFDHFIPSYFQSGNTNAPYHSSQQTRRLSTTMPASNNASTEPDSGEFCSWTNSVISPLAAETARLATAGAYNPQIPVQAAIAYCNLRGETAVSHLTGPESEGMSTTVWKYNCSTGPPSKGPTMSSVEWKHKRANYKGVTEFGQEEPEKTTSPFNAKA